jgi:hypothetical protein
VAEYSEWGRLQVVLCFVTLPVDNHRNYRKPATRRATCRLIIYLYFGFIVKRLRDLREAEILRRSHALANIIVDAAKISRIKMLVHWKIEIDYQLALLL